MAKEYRDFRLMNKVFGVWQVWVKTQLHLTPKRLEVIMEGEEETETILGSESGASLKTHSTEKSEVKRNPLNLKKVREVQREKRFVASNGKNPKGFSVQKGAKEAKKESPRKTKKEEPNEDKNESNKKIRMEKEKTAKKETTKKETGIKKTMSTPGKKEAQRKQTPTIVIEEPTPSVHEEKEKNVEIVGSSLTEMNQKQSPSRNRDNRMSPNGENRPSPLDRLQVKHSMSPEGKKTGHFKLSGIQFLTPRQNRSNSSQSPQNNEKQTNDCKKRLTPRLGSFEDKKETTKSPRDIKRIPKTNPSFFKFPLKLAKTEKDEEKSKEETKEQKETESDSKKKKLIEKGKEKKAEKKEEKEEKEKKEEPVFLKNPRKVFLNQYLLPKNNKKETKEAKNTRKNEATPNKKKPEERLMRV